ncbi:MAG: secretin N-terminal domain-containing protein [Chlamydia sp.]
MEKECILPSDTPPCISHGESVPKQDSYSSHIHHITSSGYIVNCYFFRVASFFFSMLCLPSWNSLHADSTPPSSYDSLTENRGTFMWMQERREKLAQQKKEKAESKTFNENLPEKASSSSSALQNREERSTSDQNKKSDENEGALINFNNVSITEVLKYVSRLTGKNFIYDPSELQFSITMISDSETSTEELIAMLLQNLQIHGFSLIEQGNGFIIHANPGVKGISGIYQKEKGITGPQIATQVFLLQNVEAEKCSAIIRAMLSKDALVEVIEPSKLVISDIAENIQKLGDLIKKIDTQNNGLEIGQYVSINLSPTVVTSLSERIMLPLAGIKPLILVPHTASNSVFIVSTPYLIERTLAVMQTLDLNQARSGVLWSEENRFDSKLAENAKKQLEENAIRESKNPASGLSSEELDSLPRVELDRILLGRGFTPVQIKPLSDRELRNLLWQEISAMKENQIKEYRDKQLYTDADLPIGSVESTQFLIYKLQYRKSSDITTALRAIASSLLSTHAAAQGGTESSSKNLDLTQSDLIITLNSLQAVDDNNTIVFTGTKSSLDKVKMLIGQIDIPVRQVFIEALVLETSLSNSLEFGMEWASKMQKPTSGSQFGFLRPENSTFGTAFNNIQQASPTTIPGPMAGGLSAGAIGRKIKFKGLGFRSTGALINALHHDGDTHIMMNPKITTEHNITAEIFVGSSVPIKGQSIANATTGSSSSIVATNYETQQVGVSLRVTPLISSHDTVTLIIEQRVSHTDQQAVQAQGSSVAPPATVEETRTTTRVHLPSDHFLVISGMIHESKGYKNDRVPCLGGLPFFGSFFGVKHTDSLKRNTMIFIRPIILDTPNDINEITQKQEQVLKAKSKVLQGWDKDVGDLLDLLNL